MSIESLRWNVEDKYPCRLCRVTSECLEMNLHDSPECHAFDVALFVFNSASTHGAHLRETKLPGRSRQVLQQLAVDLNLPVECVPYYMSSNKICLRLLFIWESFCCFCFAHSAGPNTKTLTEKIRQTDQRVAVVPLMFSL